MIDKKCFTKEWIESFKDQKEHKNIQAPILEKMIHAFHLLELLKTQGLDFVFKGGTSLILLLEEGNRFSIDIDIICTAGQEELEKVLQSIADSSNFISVNLDAKRSYKPGGVPKAHYMLEYPSVYENEPGKLLLDILLEKPVYPVTIESPIETKWIETTGSHVTVSTPDIDSITGDKLTAFAPNTTGIPYYKGEDSFSMEISKQLYDLGKLFLRINNMETVRASFQAFAKDEIEYRTSDESFQKKDMSPSDVLQDIIDTCLMITKRDGNKEEPFKTQYADMDKGIRSFGNNFLMSGKFRIEDAIIATARVAHLAAKLMTNDMSPIIYYQQEDISELNIGNDDWHYLNKLKKQPDKSSFFYWYNTLIILGVIKNKAA